MSKSMIPLHLVAASTVRHGSEPFSPTFDNLTSVPVAKTIHAPYGRCINYQNLCRSLDGLHGAHIKKSDSDPQIFERSQSLHSLHQDADSSEDSEQQEETASNSSRHSPSPILGARRKNLHSSLNDIHLRFSSTPIPITAPSQPCSRSRPNPPTSFKSPLTPGKPSGSSGSNTKHGDLQELQKGQRAQTMLIQLQNFTGGPSTRFDRWIKLFENIVAMSNWKEKEKINMLVTKMASSAYDILQNILESVTQDYKEVIEVKRHPGEAILDYGFRLKNILERGYPKGEDETKTDETTRLQMLCQKFLQGLDKTHRNKVRYKPFTTYEALVAEINKYALCLDGEKEGKDKREFINAVENNSTSIKILKAIEKLPETINTLATGTRYPQKVPEKDGNPQRPASAD
ncbi:hypothetical protein OUZ56_026140 [Daphnia magna]|uniref:Retrotransposon gag domain-containing protein n=1 Tax=Daphnia magna TaxID=35525 RepID=A0ABQ9ZL05_9CRUS|nr:hypothetical protein OUZ56_026140 [Daphnia magna]